MLSFFDLVVILLVLTAAFGWVNHKIVGLPHSIGILVMGLAASLVLVAAELAFPSSSPEPMRSWSSASRCRG